MTHFRLACIVAFVLCFATPTRSAPATYTIDVILPLTGSQSFLGQDQARMFTVFQRFANATGGIGGMPIAFAVHDDQSSPQTAVQLANEVIARQPAVILGSSVVALCSAMAPLMVNGPVQYCLTPGLQPPHGGYVFAEYVTTRYTITTSLNYLKHMGWNWLAIISSNDATGQEGDKNMQAILAAPEYHDVQVVAWEHFAPGDLSVSAQVARIKAAQPQVVFVRTVGTPFGTVIRNLNDAGMNLPVMTSSGNTNPTQLDQYKGFLPKTLLFDGGVYSDPAKVPPGPVRDAIERAYGAYRAVGIKNPEATELASWDSAQIVVAGLRKLGATATAAQLRDYIANLHGFVGINGIYDFSLDQHGLTDKSVVVVQWNEKAHKGMVVSGPGGSGL
jgi:branched-chain amino acid transport system substrate-binding protein